MLTTLTEWFLLLIIRFRILNMVCVALGILAFITPCYPDCVFPSTIHFSGPCLNGFLHQDLSSLSHIHSLFLFCLSSWERVSGLEQPPLDCLPPQTKFHKGETISVFFTVLVTSLVPRTLKKLTEDLMVE